MTPEGTYEIERCKENGQQLSVNIDHNISFEPQLYSEIFNDGGRENVYWIAGKLVCGHNPK